MKRFFRLAARLQLLGGFRKRLQRLFLGRGDPREFFIPCGCKRRRFAPEILRERREASRGLEPTDRTFRHA